MLDNFRFNSSFRLRKKHEIQSVLRKGNRIFGSYFILCFRLNDADRPRLGIIASKRNLRLAVDRNKYKRLIRERFRFKKNELKCFDIVIIVRKLGNRVTNLELFQCLENLFDKLNED